MSDQTEYPEISLCSRTFPVVPQRIARMQAGIGDVIAKAAADGGELTPATFMRFASARLYEVMCALIPGVEEIPEWKFGGFVDEQAFNDGKYDARSDATSPTLPELMAAFQAAIVVNRLNEVIGAMLDPKVIRALKAEINAAILDSITTSLPNSLQANGASDLTSSSAPRAIGGESAESRSLASTA